MVYPSNINLNLNTQYVLPIPTAQQGDTARVLTFNILNNGVPFNLTGKTVRAKIIKPDGTKVYNDLTITNVTNGECNLALTNQVLAVVGIVKCQLEITEGQDILSTIIFNIEVRESIDVTGAVESSNEFTALQNGLTKLDEWDKYFKETSGAIEEKYTERLNEIDSSLEESNTQIANLNNTKVDKVDGKGLSEANFTNDEKIELSNMKYKAEKSELDVERKRIDAFTSLTNGSTTGDAELIDGRIGGNNKRYNNIGSAIRGQFNDLNSKFNDLRLKNYKENIAVTIGMYIDFENGQEKVIGNNTYAVSDYIKIPNNLSNILTNFNFNLDGIAGWAIYDINKKYISGGQTLSIDSIPLNAYYIRFTNYNSNNIHSNLYAYYSFLNLESIQADVMNTNSDVKQVQLSLIPNSYVSKTNGIRFSVQIENVVSSSEKIIIPNLCNRIETNSNIKIFDDAGWAIYDINGQFLKGGKYNIITDIPKGAYYIAFSHSTCEITSPYVKFYLGIAQNGNEEIKRIIDNTIKISPNLVKGYFVNKNTGEITKFKDETYAINDNYIIIPNNAKQIYFNIDINLEGVAGWAIYDINGKFIKGGQSNTINIEQGFFAIVLTNYNKMSVHNNIYVTFKIGNYNNSVFATKSLGFVGDSITFGYDQDKNGEQLQNPWVKQVGRNLKFGNTLNYGVSSATLMVGLSPKCWVRDYTTLSDSLDYVGTMIGINDAYRGYSLGTMSDRTQDTFYGALHVYWKNMLIKYPPKNNKKLFAIIYPHYDGLDNWNLWVNAMKEVSEYYSIPICDLSKELGVSPYMDTNFEYWREESGKPGKHNAHPTQLCADQIAKCISNFINRMFGLEFIN